MLFHSWSDWGRLPDVVVNPGILNFSDHNSLPRTSKITHADWRRYWQIVKFSSIIQLTLHLYLRLCKRRVSQGITHARDGLQVPEQADRHDWNK